MLLTADRVLHLARTLPEWRADLDDDPVWLLDPTTVGLYPLPVEPGIRGHLRRARVLANDVRTDVPRTEVDLDLVLYTGQAHLRVDALAHYLRHPDDPTALFDRDGWFGNDHPVLCTLPSPAFALAVLDGNNRTAAARLRGDTHLTAHLVDPDVE